MLKLAIKHYKKQKQEKDNDVDDRIEKNNHRNNSKNRNKISLAYTRGLLDYQEQKYHSAITHFNSIVENHHDAAYMAILASLKLNNHESAGLFLEKYEQHINSWQSSEEKEFAQKRIDKLKEMISAGKIFISSLF